MDLELRGKTAIVTGASQGIGREIALALHAEGVSVAMIARSQQRLRQAARALREGATSTDASVYPVVADLSLAAEVERAVEEAVRQLGHVDILVNNAAKSGAGSFFQLTDDAIDEVFRVKALGYVRMVRAVAPAMMERGSGSILNIVGSAARVPTTDFIAGSMANAALVNFTRGISRELARRHVRINAISPGWTLTERQTRSFELQAAAHKTTLDEVVELAARAVPLGRLVAMSEIARMVLLLASDVFPSVTGEDIVIDGGAVPSV